MQPGVAVPRLAIEHVPAARPECGPQGDWSEGRATDSKNHHVVVLASCPGGKSLYLIKQNLIRWQIHEADRATDPQRVEPTLRISELLSRPTPHPWIDAARRDHHVRVIDAKRHLTLPQR